MLIHSLNSRLLLRLLKCSLPAEMLQVLVERLLVLHLKTSGSKDLSLIHISEPTRPY